ncbi:MAG: hypothetical protein GXP63_01755 [DPANN group archaeon]|nr:hypothetical protein [DPANN group archaeon]
MRTRQTGTEKQEKKRYRTQLFLTLGLLQLTLLVLLLLPSPQTVIGQTYYSNTTVLTKLNISNAAPIVYNVFIYDNDSLAGGDMILTPGTTDRIFCNATVNDSNGWTDVNISNGTLFHAGNFSDPNDNNVRYENTSCSIMQNNGFADSALVTCSFEVYFYADAGAWNCSIEAEDNSSVSDQAFANSTKTIAQLYAIDLDTAVVDYGVLNVTEVSSPTTVNITNAGNMHINLSVEGYGSSLHDDLAMNCSKQSTIAVGLERYALTASANWSVNMTPLTSNPLTNGIGNLTIWQNEDDLGNSTNTTWWAIKAPIGAESGACNGSLVFSAIPA